jgi:hypothetical protein
MIIDRQAQPIWPDLPQPFSTALQDAVDYILAEFDPVGIVATGTIVRGEAHAHSDLDLYVVHLAAYRRRVQRFFNDVPTEIFVNPPSAVRAYFVEEDQAGRRLTAHMLATGFVVFRTGQLMDELRAEAQQWLAKETSMSEFERVAERYGIASQLEDAIDVLGTDEDTATMLLADAVLAMLEYACKSSRGQIPRRKELLATLTLHAPEIARLATAFYRAATVAERATIALGLADQTIAARGFFPWDSGPGPVPN